MYGGYIFIWGGINSIDMIIHFQFKFFHKNFKYSMYLPYISKGNAFWIKMLNTKFAFTIHLTFFFHALAHGVVMMPKWMYGNFLHFFNKKKKNRVKLETTWNIQFRLKMKRKK